MIDQEERDIAWLAGLLEGEGCFRIQSVKGKHRAYIKVQLKMCDLDVIQHAAKVMPVSSSILQLDKPNRKPTYEMYWYGERAETVMRAVLPYMGERRTAKIKECLSTPNLSHHPRVKS